MHAFSPALGTMVEVKPRNKSLLGIFRIVDSDPWLHTLTSAPRSALPGRAVELIIREVAQKFTPDTNWRSLFPSFHLYFVRPSSLPPSINKYKPLTKHQTYNMDGKNMVACHYDYRGKNQHKWTTKRGMSSLRVNDQGYRNPPILSAKEIMSERRPVFAISKFSLLRKSTTLHFQGWWQFPRRADGGLALGKHC